MLKQQITFTDFNGETRTETLYFNLTEAELVDWSADSEEGIQKEMQDAILAKDMRKLLDFVKELVARSYGERDKDGIHFHKSPEITARFVNSAMYSPLLLSLFADEGGATSAFIRGLMPADLVKRAMEQGAIPNPDNSAEQNEIRQQYAPSARDVAAAAREQASQPQFNEAAPIGQPVQSSPSMADAAPVQVDSPDAPKPFKVKETPLDAEAAEELSRREARERAEFEAWKAQRDAQ
ncbi:hypothetical protein PBI_CAMILLE_40 [Microbacterium phage Camille]|nr:hypothetical protein PBI_CAMILLE_40 [Microbacterium phage Camille]